MSELSFFERYKNILLAVPQEDDTSGPSSQRNDFSIGEPGYLLRSVMVWSTLTITLVLGGVSGADPVVPPFKYTNPQMADRCSTPITPDNSTFGIWGIIYAFQAIYVVWQTWPTQKDHPLLGRLAVYNSGAYLASCAWLIAFGNAYVFTAELIIVIYLLFLLYAYYYLGVGLAAVNLVENFCCFVPVSMHVAWVLLATILGFNIALECGAGWTVTPDFAVMCLTLAGLITVYIQLTRSDVIFAGVVAWASTGIRRNTTSDSVGRATTALFWVAIMSCLAGLVIFRFNRRGRKGFKQSRFLVFPDIEEDQEAAHRYRLGHDLDAADFGSNNPAVPLSEG
jgi:hypothetical protein